MVGVVWCGRKFSPRHDSSDFSCDTTDCVLVRSQSMQHYYFWVEDIHSPVLDQNMSGQLGVSRPFVSDFTVIGYMRQNNLIRPARADEAFDIGILPFGLCNVSTGPSNLRTYR